jgi:hypothetical protein
MPTLNLRLEKEYKVEAWPKDKVTLSKTPISHYFMLDSNLGYNPERISSTTHYTVFVKE